MGGTPEIPEELPNRGCSPGVKPSIGGRPGPCPDPLSSELNRAGLGARRAPGLLRGWKSSLAPCPTPFASQVRFFPRFVIAEHREEHWECLVWS